MTIAQHDNVKAVLGRLADSSSNDRLLRVYRAAATIGDDELAAEAAKQLADHAKTGRFDWRLTYARHLARAKNHRAADAAFDRVLAEPMEQNISLEQQAEIYVEAARAAVAVNNLDKAVERFLRASNLKAADPKQAEELLGVLVSAKQTNLAILVLRQLDRSDRVLRRIVDVYEMAQQAEKAVPEMEELYRRHPDDITVVRRLAELAVARRDFTAGLNYYKALQQLRPDNTDVRAKVAETMLFVAREDVAAKHYDPARAMFDESFHLQPPDDKLKREYGGFLATTGHFDEAIAMLEPLTDAESRLQLAAVLEMQGNPTRALQILLALERTQTVGQKAERSIARLLLADRKYEAAANRLIDLLEREPNDPQLQREFLDAVAAMDHWSDAVRRTMCNVYHQYQQSGFHALDTAGFERFGDALRRLGMYEEAGIVLKQAVAEFPKTRRLRFYLAETLNNLGRYDDAEVQYKLLLNARPSLQ
jgi:tetratricopeptide (TPR) repeat protein